MTKSRERTKSASSEHNATSARGGKGTDALERQQKKMEDKLTKFSSQVNKKFSALLSMLESGSAVYNQNNSSSPSHQMEEEDVILYQSRSYSEDQTRSRVQSRLSGISTTGPRSRAGSTESVNSSDIEELKDRPISAASDSQRSSIVGTPSSAVPDPMNMASPLSSNCVSPAVDPTARRKSTPTSAPGVLRMHSLVNNAIVPILENSQENSVAIVYSSESEEEKSRSPPPMTMAMKNSHAHSSGSEEEHKSRTPPVSLSPKHAKKSLAAVFAPVDDREEEAEDNDSEVRAFDHKSSQIATAPMTPTTNNTPSVSAFKRLSNHNNNISGNNNNSNRLSIHGGPSVSIVQRIATPERQATIRTLQQDPARLDATNSRKAQSTAIVFSEFMAARIRQQKQQKPQTTTTQQQQQQQSSQETASNLNNNLVSSPTQSNRFPSMSRDATVHPDGDY